MYNLHSKGGVVLGYNIETRDKNLIAHFYGELDHHMTEGARKDIDRKYMDNDIRNIIFNFSNLTLMDSSGIGLVMGRYKNVVNKKGRVIIISANVYIDRIIKMSGLLKIIDVYSDLNSALENIKEVK